MRLRVWYTRLGPLLSFECNRRKSRTTHMHTHTRRYCHILVSVLFLLCVFTVLFRYRLIFQTGFVTGASKTHRFNLSLQAHPSVIGIIILVIETLVQKNLRHLRIVNDSIMYILRSFQKRSFSYNFIVTCLRTIRYYCMVVKLQYDLLTFYADTFKIYEYKSNRLLPGEFNVDVNSNRCNFAAQNFKNERYTRLIL